VLAYSRELLSTSPDRDSVKDRHAEWFTARAGSDPDSIAHDVENMTAALDWLGSKGERDPKAAALGLELAGAMGSHWYRHGQARQGSEPLERLLKLDSQAAPAVRANALRRLGVLLEQLRDPDAATAPLQEALQIYRDLGDRAGEAGCLNSLGIVARTAGNPDDARPLLESALEIRRELGDVEGESATLSNLGVLAVDRREFALAADLFEESVAIDKQRGDEWGAAITASNLGVVRIEQGDSEAGTKLITEAMLSLAALDDMDGVASCLEAMAAAHIHDGRPVQGVRMEGAALTARAHYGLPEDPAELERKRSWLDRARRSMGDVAYEEALDQGRQMTVDQAIAYALGRGMPF
jgi:tetratricopeptide (TPR) repeat protein